jgi:hypothetical protein
MKRFLTVALVLCATAASARDFVVPVITGTVPGRIFSTTVQVKNPAAADAQCTFLYAGPERIGNPLRSDETIPAGKTKLAAPSDADLTVAGLRISLSITSDTTSEVLTYRCLLKSAALTEPTMFLRTGRCRKGNPACHVFSKRY